MDRNFNRSNKGTLLSAACSRTLKLKLSQLRSLLKNITSFYSGEPEPVEIVGDEIVARLKVTAIAKAITETTMPIIKIL